ncbi:MAG: arginyl-tRNA synthetase [Solirubrobacteraceae bacterium]|jgi:arginyl-tRNA synthetase|nr:arginyl-tRNA synthetase [Solirubrobacteraceae bacterium]
MTPPLVQLRAAVEAAAAAVRGGDGEAPVQLRVERPKRENQGDYSTNVAMLLAPSLGEPPRVIAERVGAELASTLAGELAGWEIAGPGFLNLTLSDDWYRGATRAVLDAGDRYGADAVQRPERVLLEFVSANPTGPLVAANGQAAAYGDALARILSHWGHRVQREYYFNDAGGQIRLLGQSVQARARGDEIPEGGYQGEYVADLAAAIPNVESLTVEEAAHAAVEIVLGQVKATLERYGVHYDRFFSERTLHEGAPSYLDRALEIVAEGGNSYHSEGALWLRTTAFGDDKDRVLRRSDGGPTYLAADLAYLLEKSERGIERQLLPVGADHHGYVARMKAAFAALGGDPDRLEMPILQFVHLVEGSERAAMSKRRGEFIRLDELLDEIGVDATRYFMLQRSHDRTVDLDLDLAKRQDRENPVYYIQYAHARIVTMLGKLSSERVQAALASGTDWGDTELHPAERALIKALAAFPDEVAEAAIKRGPHRIAAYALELAQEFTAFYRDCKVVGSQPEPVESFRIALSQSARQTIALALSLLGVSAPDSM